MIISRGMSVSLLDHYGASGYIYFFLRQRGQAAIVEMSYSWLCTETISNYMLP